MTMCSEKCEWKHELEGLKVDLVKTIDGVKEELQHVDQKFTDELSKGSERFIAIAADLGEIKGALKVKKEIQTKKQRISEKLAFLLVGSFVSGLVALAIHLITKFS